MSRKKHKPEKVHSDPPSIFQKLSFHVLGLIHVVCPLLFFTNLTRNPYYTQIALLNVAISVCGLLWVAHIWKSKEWRVPRIPIEWPLLVLLIVAFISTALSWQDHPTVRIGIGYEALRIWTFTLINMVLSFYLPLLFVSPTPNDGHSLEIWSDLVLAMIWGGMWFFFHDFKENDPTSYIWDTYGAILWFGACIYAVVRTRRGRAVEYFHVIFVVGFLASIYGIMQYAGRDFIWSSVVQPYGGRPVSTFGNPNFLSSYLMLVSPLALVFAIRSKGAQAAGYLFIAIVTALGVLATLTRSTYLGLMGAYFVLGIFLFKREHLKNVKWASIALGLFILLILFFPKTPLSEFQSPLARFTEIFQEREEGETYGPWHQRLLIWSSAWDMVEERPIVGKGWGTFELFYPFYQGHYLLAEMFPRWRTHANNAHNILLEIWAQVGTLGTGAGIWFFICMFIGGWTVYRRKPDGLSKIVLAGLLAGFWGMLIDNFMGNVSIFFAVPAFLFWWNMGSIYNESKNDFVKTKPLGAQAHVFLTFVTIICLFVIGYFVKRWNQERYYFEGFKYAKGNQLQPSIKALEKAYSWFEGEVNSNYEMGNSYARHAKGLKDRGFEAESIKNKKQAARGYQAALHANPGYDEIYFNLGVTHVQLGNTEEAIRNLELAVFINPLLEGAYSALTTQYLNTNQIEKGRDLLEQGVLAFPYNKDLWNNLGFIYGKLNQPEKQLEAFRRSFQSDPSFEVALKNIYVATQGQSKPDPYLEIPGLINKMESYLQKQEYDKALPLSKRVAELMPYNADAQLSSANLYFYLKQEDKAIELLKKAIKLKPKFLVARANLAKIYVHQGNFKQARAQIRRIKEINPNHPDLKDLDRQMLK